MVLWEVLYNQEFNRTSPTDIYADLHAVPMATSCEVMASVLQS